MSCKKVFLSLILILMLCGGLPQRASANGEQDVQLQVTITSEEWGDYHQGKQPAQPEEPTVPEASDVPVESGDTPDPGVVIKQPMKGQDHQGQEVIASKDADKQPNLPQTGSEKRYFSVFLLGKGLLIVSVVGLLWRRKKQVK